MDRKEEDNDGGQYEEDRCGWWQRTFPQFDRNSPGELPGTDVSSFEDGHKAWMALQDEDSVDIVITDVNMPKMDGFELLNKIKEKDPEKPCIIMSAIPRYKKIAQDLRADGFLAKPFKISDLFKVVAQFA